MDNLNASNSKVVSIAKAKFEPCLVCGDKTKGLHFQVNVCRACAEFFRRSVQNPKAYKCMRGTQDCNLLKVQNDKRLCRFCRFKKCKELGMSLEKEKFDNSPMVEIEDPKQEILCNQPMNSVIVKKEDAVPKDGVVHRMETNLFSLTKIQVNGKPRFKLDMAPLEDMVKKVIGQNFATPIVLDIRLTLMQRLRYAFTLFYEEIKPQPTVTVTNEFDLFSLHKQQTKFMVGFAKMLMYCEQFSALDYPDKYAIYKYSWQLIYQLERQYTSILVFGNDPEDYRMMHDDLTALDMKRWDRIAGEEPESERVRHFEKARKLWEPFFQKNRDYIMIPMKNLMVTEFELVYLIAQVVWNTQDKGLSPRALQMAEEVSEQLSNELHNYYVYEIGLMNYAHRLVKLTKLIDALKTVMCAKNNVFIIARVFDMFDCDCNKNDLFDVEWKE